jgi:hypothetical protein
MIITAIAPEFSEFNDLVVKEHFLIKKKSISKQTI